MCPRVVVGAHGKPRWWRGKQYCPSDVGHRTFRPVPTGGDQVKKIANDLRVIPAVPERARPLHLYVDSVLAGRLRPQHDVRCHAADDIDHERRVRIPPAIILDDLEGQSAEKATTVFASDVELRMTSSGATSATASAASRIPHSRCSISFSFILSPPLVEPPNGKAKPRARRLERVVGPQRFEGEGLRQ